MVTVTNTGTQTPPEVHERLQNIWAQGQYFRTTRHQKRLKPPLIRLWDGDWNFVGTIGDVNEASFQWKLNDTGAANVQVPHDSWVTKWVTNVKDRDTKNIHITMDKDGSRWSGRLKSFTLTKTAKRQRFLDMTFLHDYEELKHIYAWPNPTLPAAVQFPRAFTLTGPTAWVLKVTLMMNIWRLAGDVWALPDDPLDISQWFNEFTTRHWPIQVKPGGILGDTTPWTVISSRMKNFHDLAEPKLADAQLSVECRRYLEGDDLPWEGANISHGALVVDIVDKSGWWSEEGTATSFFGDIWKGLVRTTQSVVGAVDTTHTVVPTPDDVPEYRDSNWLGTHPSYPYVIYRDGPITGLTTSDFTWQPATTVQEVTGGKSTYGVNEGISAAVQLAGNYLGAVIGLFSLGGIADSFLQPIYSDTILAWMSTKSGERARDLGWSHYYEHFADGADKAYTISSIIALRQGFWETRERTSHKIELADGAPWFIGDNGEGHFFLGDRIGSTIEGLTGDMTVVEQVTELNYTVSRGGNGWSATCGDPKSQQSPLETALGKIRDAAGAVQQIGVI